MTQIGFGGQWVEVFRAGRHTSGNGVTGNFDRAFLNQVVNNTASGDAPAVVGHPETNAPAYGWASALRMNGDVLEAQFSDCETVFEEMVREKRFPKRSASFYLNPPKLRHVGFLGAQAPAIKGLREIQFNQDGGDSVTVEISFSEENLMDKEKETTQEEKNKFIGWMKEMFGGTPAAPAAPSANFSEADVHKIVDAAIKTANEKTAADFSEKLTAKDQVIETLSKQVNAITTSGKRAEIVSFVESIPAEKGKHFLKNAGVVEFLEACADADARDAEKAVVVFSEGAGGAPVETKFSRLEWAKDLLKALPSFVSFGEQFGALKATNQVEPIVNPQELTDLRSSMGVKSVAGGEK